MSETQDRHAAPIRSRIFPAGFASRGEIAVVWRRGYRMVRWTYADLLRAPRILPRAAARGIAKGDRVLIWGENSGEWIAAFLGCVFRGAVAVPMDAIAEKSFAQRVAQQAGVRFAVVARGLPSLDGVPASRFAGRLGGAASRRTAAEFSSSHARTRRPGRNRLHSGTTAEPRGVVLTHGNLLANLEPIEREFDALSPLRAHFPSPALSRSSAAEPRLRSAARNFLPQILGATSVFLDTLNPARSDPRDSRRARFRAGHRAAA